MGATITALGHRNQPLAGRRAGKFNGDGRAALRACENILDVKEQRLTTWGL
jgi:hypothetical protein